MTQIYKSKEDLFAHEQQVEQIVLIHPFFLDEFSTLHQLKQRYIFQNHN